MRSARSVPRSRAPGGFERAPRPSPATPACAAGGRRASWRGQARRPTIACRPAAARPVALPHVRSPRRSARERGVGRRAASSGRGPRSQAGTSCTRVSALTDGGWRAERPGHDEHAGEPTTGDPHGRPIVVRTRCGPPPDYVPAAMRACGRPKHDPFLRLRRPGPRAARMAVSAVVVTLTVAACGSATGTPAASAPASRVSTPASAAPAASVAASIAPAASAAASAAVSAAAASPAAASGAVAGITGSPAAADPAASVRALPVVDPEGA